MIPFNIPAYAGNEKKYIARAIKNTVLSGNGSFGQACEDWFRNKTGSTAFLTPSGTASLEMAAILAGIQAGDEVIMPSFTHPSTANAFVLRGARIVFVDIRPDTMNIDEKLIEDAITPKTKILMMMHYAGVGCEMDRIREIAIKHKLLLIEDAAMGIMAYYKDRMLGTLGDMSCFSFHETKNISCGEGGALLFNNPDLVSKAEVVRDKGTDRQDFLRGKIPYYSWINPGSSFLLSELNAAYLFAQLEKAEVITNKRKHLWSSYFDAFSDLNKKGLIKLPYVPDYCRQNGHLFYLKFQNKIQRQDCIEYLKKHEIMAIFHYIPLHSSKAGRIYGKFHGNDKYTTIESEKILRLPLYFQMNFKQLQIVVDHIYRFLKQK